MSRTLRTITATDLIFARTHKGLSKAATVRELKVDYSTYQRWEKGEVAIPSHRYTKIREVLDFASLPGLSDPYIEEAPKRISLADQERISLEYQELADLIDGDPNHPNIDDYLHSLEKLIYSQKRDEWMVELWAHANATLREMLFDKIFPAHSGREAQARLLRYMHYAITTDENPTTENNRLRHIKQLMSSDPTSRDYYFKYAKTILGTVFDPPSHTADADDPAAYV